MQNLWRKHKIGFSLFQSSHRDLESLDMNWVYCVLCKEGLVAQNQQMLKTEFQVYKACQIVAWSIKAKTSFFFFDKEDLERVKTKWELLWVGEKKMLI